ncbi:FHA domain-containing protein At4g14490 [Eucalyptus grandis]|uniref:FHA domain-containing protein At4g14490 n=1 Tax=Eucalyptus grandis TaxID=71139 RepID=UPI00192ED730|nr:FHA domain-containing protein At4g14490 [Eucalyptus grandis]
MASLSLKLHITKGPREGETLEYPPGSTVRIGRVLRGNNLAIKDAGISSKHISIESRPAAGPEPSGGNAWALTDLGSSNGTFVNESTRLAPDAPYVLRDGDCIKIGELTAFLVKIEGCGGGEAESRLRRNPRRRANERNSEKEAAAPVVESRAGSVRVPKGRGGKTELPEAGSGAAAAAAPAWSAKSELVEASAVRGFEGEACGAESRNAGTARENSGISRVSPRRTRRRKKEEDNPVAGAVVEKGLEDGGTKKDEGKERNTRSRRTRQAKGRNRIGDSERAERLDPVEEARDDVVANEESAGLPNTESVHGNDEREVVVGRSQDAEQVADEGEVLGESKRSGSAEQVSGEDGCGVRSIKVEIEDDVILEAGPSNEVRSGIGFASKETTGKSGQFPDFSKMSLREWFDYMEVYLPKQITDETEKLISEMRAKALRVREYVAEQKKQKGKAIS